MSTRIQEWLQAENTAVKTYEELQAKHAEAKGALDYHETVGNPWNEQSRMENELRKQLGAPPTWANNKEKIEFHRRQLALLEKANQAPRCGHLYSDGTRCRAPKLRKDKVCYAHAQMQAVRPRRLNLPPLEDANAVILWLMEVSRALLEGEITERTAGLLFYGLQMAMVTARWTTFRQTKPEEMVRSVRTPDSPRRRRDAEKSRAGEEPQAGAPAVHIDNAALPPHQANAGLPPHQAKIALGGDPGVEPAKSIFFGVEREGGGIADMAVIARDRTCIGEPER